MKHFTLVILTAFFALLLFADSGVGAVAPQEGAESSRDLRAGERLYKRHCLACHGRKGRHPDKTFNLADAEWRSGCTIEAIQETIRKGVEGTAMVPFEKKLRPKDVERLALYVRQLGANDHCAEN